MFKYMIYSFLSKKRDQKRQEVYSLRWEKAKLEKQLEELKAAKKQTTKG